MRRYFSAFGVFGLLIFSIVAFQCVPREIQAQQLTSSPGNFSNSDSRLGFRPPSERNLPSASGAYSGGAFGASTRAMESTLPAPSPNSPYPGPSQMQLQNPSIIKFPGDSGGGPTGCYQPFVAGVGYYDQSKIEDWIVSGSPSHFGAALDVAVQSNNCPISTGYMSYNPWGLLYLRAMRWKWDQNWPYQVTTTRLSPSQPGEFGPDPSNSYPGNFQYSLDGYFSSITLPLHISSNGRAIYGSEQFSHSSLYDGAQEKLAFVWKEDAPAGPSFSLLSDYVSPNQTGQSCRLSSAAYSASEVGGVPKIVGQGTSDPSGLFSDGICVGSRARAASFTEAGLIQPLYVNQTNDFSYAAAVSPDGVYSVINKTVAGRSYASYFVSSAAGVPAVQLKYLGNVVTPGPLSQAEALAMSAANPSSALIFGHVTQGPPGNVQNEASAAVIWDSNGVILHNAGTTFTGLPLCDAEECSSAEARDGSAYKTMVGVVYFPDSSSIGNACRISLGRAGAPREAFVYTPEGQMQKLRDFALSKISSSSAAGVAARTELGKWSGLCEATGIAENANVITISGIGARKDDQNPNVDRIQGFVIHLPKPSYANGSGQNQFETAVLY